MMKSIKKSLLKLFFIITLTLFIGLGSGLLFNSTSNANPDGCPQNYCPDFETFLCPATYNWVQCVNAGSYGCYHTGC